MPSTLPLPQLRCRRRRQVWGRGKGDRRLLSGLNLPQRRQMIDKIQHFKFSDPQEDALSPAGEYNLRLGVMKEIKPEMIATRSEK